jgi:hypothetical protein
MSEVGSAAPSWGTKPGAGSSAAPRLVALMPPGPTVRLLDFKPIVRASEEARFFLEHASPAQRREKEALTDVLVGVDAELAAEAVELLGARVRLEIPCRVRLPSVVFQLRDTGRFFGLELSVVDSEGRGRSILATNKASSIRVTGDTVALPLEFAGGADEAGGRVGQGWFHLRLDLADICQRAFGCGYGGCVGVIVHASVAVARIYFESRPFEDFELPAFLQTLRASPLPSMRGGGGSRGLGGGVGGEPPRH